MSDLKVSIIIVNWNTKELLKNCVDSVIEQTTKISYEIIVVDNYSSDGSATMIENEYKNVVLIKNTENKGFAVANNQALKIAKGEYLLLLNSDTIILDRAIEKCFDYISKYDDIGLIGCRLLNSDRTLQHSCYNFNSITNAVLFKTGIINKLNIDKRYKYEGLIKSFDYNTELDVDYVCGAYMMFSRKVFEKVGYLDESFFMYAEEADYCARVKKIGYRVVYNPNATIIHFGGGSSRKISLASEKRRIVSRLLFIKKNKGYLNFCLYRFFSILNVVNNIICFTIKNKKEQKEFYQEKLKAILHLKYE